MEEIKENTPSFTEKKKPSLVDRINGYGEGLSRERMATLARILAIMALIIALVNVYILYRNLTSA